MSNLSLWAAAKATAAGAVGVAKELPLNVVCPNAIAQWRVTAMVKTQIIANPVSVSLRSYLSQLLTVHQIAANSDPGAILARVQKISSATNVSSLSFPLSKMADSF